VGASPLAQSCYLDGQLQLSLAFRPKITLVGTEEPLNCSDDAIFLGAIVMAWIRVRKWWQCRCCRGRICHTRT